MVRKDYALWMGGYRFIGRYWKTESAWVGECVELGKATEAKTLDEARGRLLEAIRLELEQLGAIGRLDAVLNDQGIKRMRA